MVDEAEDEAIVTDEFVVSDDPTPKKRRTVDDHVQDSHDDLYQDDEPREEFKSQPTQELLLDVPPRPTTSRAIIARQSRIDRAAIRKVVSNTVIAPTPIPDIDEGHNGALFYECPQWCIDEGHNGALSSITWSHRITMTACYGRRI